MLLFFLSSQHLSKCTLSFPCALAIEFLCVINSLPIEYGGSFPVVNGGVRGVWGGQGAQRPGASTGHEYGGGSGGGGSGGNPGGAAAAAAEADSAERDFVGRTGGGDTDGGYEGKLVEEICAAGGTKSTPGKVCGCVCVY